VARDGSVGRATFERVNELVKEGLTKSQAFAKIAEETGRNSGTVSANYYRVARRSGAGKRRRRAATRTAAEVAVAPGQTQAAKASGRGRSAKSALKPRAATASSPTRSVEAGGSVEEIAAQLVKSVQELGRAVTAQQAEIDGLRERLNSVRRILA
jgi:hypothetical protein